MKQYYTIYSGKRFWIIIRNQWHIHSNDFHYLIEIGRKPRRETKEFVFTLLGFQIVLFIR